MKTTDDTDATDADRDAILAAWSSGRDGSDSWWRRNRARLGVGWLSACLLLAVMLFTRGGADLPEPASVAQASVAAVRASSLQRTKPIEQVQVGDRVHVDTSVSDQDLSLGDDVDPATWRRVRLHAPKSDGTWADVTLLRPLTWLTEHEAEVGGAVEIHVPECGISGLAEVLSIDACPPIAPGEGRIVTGTYRHSSSEVFDLRVEGLSKSIGTTGNHPFWSIDRQSFVRADSLQAGERLRGFDGPLTVIASTRRASPEPVYNLEIQVDHVYHVGSAGVLVHNGNRSA
jgi:hypothetical protein